MQSPQDQRSQYPFLAPCRQLTLGEPFIWLKCGLRDLRQAPLVSLVYGSLMTAMAIGLTATVVSSGRMWLLLSLLCLFVFAAPLACIGTYAISAQLERGQTVSFIRTVRACLQRYLGNALVYILVLLVVFLVWGRATSMVSIFMPINPDSSFEQLFSYGAALFAVCLLFSMIIFAASAFALPMIMHRDVDTVTAIISSVNAVLRNKLVMMLWASLIGVALLIGLLTFGLALIVLLPIIGHAAWHGYLATIDASEFPRHQLGITAKPRLG